MTPRTGRPKLKEPKSYTLKVRLTLKELEKLDRVCLSRGENRSEVVRKAISEIKEPV